MHFDELSKEKIYYCLVKLNLSLQIRQTAWGGIVRCEAFIRSKCLDGKRLILFTIQYCLVEKLDFTELFFPHNCYLDMFLWKFLTKLWEIEIK